MIFSIGIAHHDCGADIIGRHSIPPEALADAFGAAAEKNPGGEAFILSTCNRVEVFASGTPAEAADACAAAVSLGGKRDVSLFMQNARRFENLASVRHLFEVASGLDSQMVGETEILGQIKRAYENAAAAGACKAVFNRTLQKAIQCAKWVRTNTGIGSGSTTIGAVAAELATRIFEDISKTRILLAGSGEVGRSVAQALAARGAESITVSSRTWQNAHALSGEVGGSAIGFERVAAELGKFDIAIFALSGADGIIGPEIAAAAEASRRGAPIFLMDLAVPHNIKKECAELDGVFLYDLSDLSKVANENMGRRMAEIGRAQAEISRRAEALWARISAR